MKVYDLTLPQVEYFRTFCNFDEKEAEVFELRRQNIPLAKCAEMLHYDDIKKISQRVNKKVLKMTDTKRMEEWIENVYWKNVLFKSYIKGLENQYYLVEQSEKNMKILRHDMRHYSMIIDSLIDQQEYNEIRNIAGHINEVVNENKVHRYCENLVVNTILTKMAKQAQSLHIDLRLDILIPRQIPVNEYEFAMVLANLLENAVFSVQNMEPAKKSIDAKIHCTAEYLLIDMENECTKEIHFDSITGLPKSKRGKSHGLGMQSVQAFSDKLGGNIECYCENNRFRIILFVKFSPHFT